MAPAEIKALLFDVFGTTVDWRSGVIRAGEELGRRRGALGEVDWGAFADAWRAEYRPSMERVMRGEVPWTNLDGLHRASLEVLLRRFGLPELFSFDPGQVMMVAAHPDDLRGAMRAGLRTAFVPRPLEFGPGGAPPPREGAFDLVARDFTELAGRLGA